MGHPQWLDIAPLQSSRAGKGESMQALPGGGMSSVWRVGDTVHREAGPWTPQIHRLLSLLHAQGVTCVPAPLGMDEAGREVLTLSLIHI